MNSSSNSNEKNAASMEDSLKRRSLRLIKRKKFEDELDESSCVTMFRSPMLNSDHPRSQLLNMSSSKEIDKSMVSVHKVDTLNTTLFTSSSQYQKVQSTRHSVNSNTSRPFVSVTSTFTNPLPSNKKRSRKPNNSKYLGRWKPTDDLLLTQSVLQTNNLQMVYKGVKFSCKFTLKEIEQRWFALLFNPIISKLAVSAMRNLHPETIAYIESKTLFSIDEEKLLATVQSDSHPTVDTFQKMLNTNLNTFYHRRSAKILMVHWQLMNRYSLLSDQCDALETLVATPILSTEDMRNTYILDNEQKVTTIIPEHIPSFVEYEKLNPELEQHLKLTNNKVKKNIKVLEDELQRAQPLMFSTISIDPVEFEPQTLAILQGHLVKYLILSKEITIGRSSKYQEVDVDLKLEGPAVKVSRRQATLCLYNTGDFLITCEGRKCLYIDGKPLVTGSCSWLNNNSVLEIAGLKFLFVINHQLINAIKRDALQQNHVQLANQTENHTPYLQFKYQEFKNSTVAISEKSVLNVKQIQQKLLKDNQNQILDTQKVTIENQMQIQNEELQQLIESLLKDHEENHNQMTQYL